MHHRPSGTQGLVFGGLMAALIVIFALVPGLYFLMPVPLVLVYVRHGGRAAALAAVASTVLTMIMGGLVQGLMAIASGILPGLTFGYGFRHRWKSLSIALAAMATFVISFALSYVAARVFLFGGQDPVEQIMTSGAYQELVRAMTDAMELTLQQQEAAGADPRSLEASRTLISELREQPAALAWALLPSSLVIAGALSTGINWLLCRLTLPRFGYSIPTPAPFGDFRLPVWLVLVYGVVAIGAPFLVDMSTVVEQNWVGKLFLNIITPLGLIFAVAGAAVAYGFARRRNVAKGTAILIIALAFLLLRGAALQVLILLAMWDAIFDFRGLGHGWIKRPTEKT